MLNIKNRIRVLLEERLIPSGFYFKNEGFCACCDKNVIFKSYNSWLRDFYRCSNCGSIPRERALIKVIEEKFPEWRNIKIHESSPEERGASVKLSNQCKGYIGSHFFPGELLGKVVGKYLNQDLESQTFEDESFDLVVTQDVMEHIFNPEKAFKEIARTLKKGGAHIFTVPLVNKHKKSEVRAKINSAGIIEHLLPPEYHGNPIDSKGCLMTMNWGYDIVDFIKKSSDLDTVILPIDNIEYGIRAEYMEVLISCK